MRISQSEIDLDDIISDLHSVTSEAPHQQASATNSAKKRTEEQKRVTQQLM